MDDKKNFFALLEPKSAVVIGVLAGVMTLCTIGFVVLGSLALNGNMSFQAKAKANAVLNSKNMQNALADEVVKSARPKAELFIMSYCPYGLQMEKAFLPVMELLKGKADMEIKFVSYAMHGMKEIEENTRQYCIETEQNDKFISYMNCFVGKGEYKTCLSEAGVDTGKLNSCVSQTNKKFGILEKYNDKSTWLSGNYPIYPVHEEENGAYGVQGSPTLVINGAQVEANRSPEAVKQAVCAAFDNPPSECQQKLSEQASSAGFGYGTGADTTGVECGS